MKKDGFGSKLIAALGKRRKKLDFDGFSVEVRPATVAISQEFARIRREGDNDKLTEYCLTVFLGHVHDPATGELAFSEADRKKVTESLSGEDVLRVVLAAINVDSEQAAKN